MDAAWQIPDHMARTFFPEFCNRQEKKKLVFLSGGPTGPTGPVCPVGKNKKGHHLSAVTFDWEEILLLEILGDDVGNQCQINLVVSTAKQMKQRIADQQPEHHTPKKCKD